MKTENCDSRNLTKISMLINLITLATAVWVAAAAYATQTAKIEANKVFSEIVDKKCDSVSRQTNYNQKCIVAVDKNIRIIATKLGINKSELFD